VFVFGGGEDMLHEVVVGLQRCVVNWKWFKIKRREP